MQWLVKLNYDFILVTLCDHWLYVVFQKSLVLNFDINFDKS